MVSYLLVALIAGSPEIFRVPTIAAPTIDNRLEQAWENAATFTLPEGGIVRLGADAESLYLSIDEMPGAGTGYGCVFICLEDSVLILHASAALGSAHYEFRDGSWFPVSKDYRWRRAERMWSEEQWKAGVAPRGTQEFAIGRQLLPERPRIAVGYVFSQGETQSSLVWPASLEDDTRNTELLGGWNPEPMTFRCDRWANLELGD